MSSSVWAKWTGTALIAVTAGCILVPTPPLGIHEIPSEQIARVRIASTTRVDVLMMIGNPSKRLQDDRLFLYRWERVRAVGGVGAPVGIPIVITDNFVLAIEFNDAGLVTRVGQLSGFTHEDLDKELEAWSPGLWRAPPSQVATAEPPPPESVEAVFSAAVWWYSQTTGRFRSQVDIRAVPGRLELTTDRVVFYERLPSAGEAQYAVRVSKLKGIAIVEDRERGQMISLVRHDSSVEQFTLMKDDGISVDTQGMQRMLEALTRKVHGVELH